VSSSARPAWPPRWWPGGLAWALWILTLLGLAAITWLDQLLHQAGRPELSWLGAGNAASMGAAVIAGRSGRWWARVAAAAAVMFVAASVVGPMPLYPEYTRIRNPFGVPALAEPPLDALVPAAGVVVLVALVVAAGR
jgi:hypothetical protein